MAPVQGSSPHNPPPHPRAWSLLERKPLTGGRAARIIALATMIVTLVGGVLMRFTDPKNFSDIGEGLWWSIQTVTTVGYGDVVPTSTLGRLVAAVVMLAGIGFLTVITATITSTFIETARQRIEEDSTDVLATKLDQISYRLEQIETSLKDPRRRERSDD
ncbi:MAG: potassium channel family protein [Solirubrobacteraceae bacterium]